MGEQAVQGATSPEEIREFQRGMLLDLDALDRMLAEERFETGVTRYGVEQELFLVDSDSCAAPVGPEVLEGRTDARLTHELARFNLEANLPPGLLAAGFLDELRAELESVLSSVRELAAPHHARPLFTGILPTLHGADIGVHNMTPSPRYDQLNANILAQRGGEIVVFIRGLDEFHRRQPDVMLEAANASIQLHLQVDPDGFVDAYNRAQLIAAPLLAVAANSPLIMGRRLWHESRIALFELATDVRSDAELARGKRPRVGFGEGWVRDSVLELFRADVMSYAVLLTRELGPRPLSELEAGRIPKLRALTLHNGTVWRWNRACYGVADGVPHLRIENRVLPSGPTIADEVANAALFYGLMSAPAEKFGDVTAMSFARVKESFISASRYGIEAPVTWSDGRVGSARELIGRVLLPIAREGLRAIGLGASEVDAALEPIEERVDRAINGAIWMLRAYESLIERGTPEWATRRLTDGLIVGQDSGKPVHEWVPLEASRLVPVELDVRHVMRARMPTLSPDDPIELADRIFAWEGVSHLVVERDAELAGLVSRDHASPGRSDVRVGEVMVEPTCVVPDLSIAEARVALDTARAGCLVVVSDGRVIGTLTHAELPP